MDTHTARGLVPAEPVGLRSRLSSLSDLNLRAPRLQAGSGLRPLSASSELARLPQEQLADRKELQAALDRWDQALEMARRAHRQEVPSDGFAADYYYGAGVPVTAPTTPETEVNPISVEAHDGTVSRSMDDLESELRSLARSIFLVPLAPVIAFDIPEEAVALRVFVFDRPVTGVRNASGELYTLGPGGELVRFQGEPTYRLVERVPAGAVGQLPMLTKDLTCTHVAGTARWTEGPYETEVVYE